MIRHAILDTGAFSLTGAPGSATASLNLPDCRGKEMSQLIIEVSNQALQYDISITAVFASRTFEVFRREDVVGDFNEDALELPIIGVYTLVIENGSLAVDCEYLALMKEEG